MAPNRKENTHGAEKISQVVSLSSIRKGISFYYILSIVPTLLLDLSSDLVSFCTLICRSRLCCRLFQPSLFSRLSHYLGIHSFLAQHYPYYNPPRNELLLLFQTYAMMSMSV